LATPCTTDRGCASAAVQLGAGAGALLRRQPGQVDRLEGADIGLARIQPAGQQDLVDQLVELARCCA
jgi:predicted TPR repeat methyltransferase